MSPVSVHASAGELDVAGATPDLGAIYRAHAPTVARWAARLGGPDVDVEDVVHDVFLVVERRIDGFRGDSSLRTWLYGITVNVVRHARRKQRWRRWLGLEASEDVPSTARSAPEVLEQRDTIRLVYRALDRLSEAHRTVLVLHELERLSGVQIAALTGLKVGTVWVRLHRARAAFVDALAACEREAR